MKMQIQNVPIINERHADSGNKDTRFNKNYHYFKIYGAPRKNEDGESVMEQSFPEKC